MKILSPLLVIIILVVIAFIGVEVGSLHFLFGVIIPYIATFIFMIGVIYRVIRWGCSPVPFRIPTTCGQQKSLSWIPHNNLENPSTAVGVIGRMALEIFLFRSLFRNTRAKLEDGSHLAHSTERWLWLTALAFHFSFLIVLIRHLRLFVKIEPPIVTPLPSILSLITTIDGFLQIGSPTVYLSGVVLLLAVTFLLFRRILSQKIRYISLPADYFPLFLIIGISFTGILMRYWTKIDVVSIKIFAIGLTKFSPVIPTNVGAIFYIHLFLVSILLAYFPFSKLVHMVGIFLSPTRNMANNNRIRRHINPWNYPVKVYTYEEYEDEFREKMKKAGIPVEF